MSDGKVERAQVEAALAASGDLIYIWDLDSDRIDWIGPITNLVGTVSVGTGNDYHGRILPADIALRLTALSRHFSASQDFDCEYRLRTTGGDVCWVHDRGRAERRDDGSPRRLLGAIRTITQRKLNEERLEYLASFDELTGHFNKSRLRQAVEHALSQCARFGRSGAFLTIDIDNLAMINDAFGPSAGDAIIVGVGELLDRCLGSSDVAGRTDGDEFGIVLDSCSEAEIGAVADRIMRMVRDTSFETAAGPVAVTVSIGGIVFPTSAQNAYDIMTRAVTALQQAKRRGRNNFFLYHLTESQRRTLRNDIGVAKQVQRALAEDRLVFAYQPVVDARTRDVAFHECLLRLQQEDGTVLAAGSFVPVVEQLGLMRQVDRHVIELAVQALGESKDACLAVNISGLTATDPAWLRSLVALLKGKPELATRLIVEITETAALQDLEDTDRFITAVRDLGCQIALDDFGSGYSSFRHLKTLTADFVKIDGAYVDKIMEQAENQLFLRTLVGLADGFGLRTVAERVETAAEAEFLTRAGVTFLQGYHVGRPQLKAPWHARGGRSGKRPELQLVALSGGGD